MPPGLGIEFRGKAPYPVDSKQLALRVGTVSAGEGWCEDYTQATFRAWFVEHKVPGTLENVEEVLATLGRDVAEMLAKAADQEAAGRLEMETAGRS